MSKGSWPAACPEGSARSIRVIARRMALSERSASKGGGHKQVVFHFLKDYSTREGNGLLFEACPKTSTSRARMLDILKAHAVEMGSTDPTTLSQLPERATKHPAPKKHAGVT